MYKTSPHSSAILADNSKVNFAPPGRSNNSTGSGRTLSESEFGLQTFHWQFGPILELRFEDNRIVWPQLDGKTAFSVIRPSSSVVRRIRFAVWRRDKSGMQSGGGPRLQGNPLRAPVCAARRTHGNRVFADHSTA